MNKMQPEQALFELTLLDAEAAEATFEDFFAFAASRGVPVEVLTRLEEVWTYTRVIGGEVVAIGKVIIRQVFDFLMANPQVAIGIAMGVAVWHLIASIPVLGLLLGPLSLLLAVLYGAGVGAATGRGANPFAVGQAFSLAAQKFFEFLEAVFDGVAQYWNADEKVKTATP